MVSPTAATVYFHKSFWSVLRSKALETAQLGFSELNGRKSCWTWPGSTKASQTFSGTFSGTLLDLTWICTKALPEPSLESSPEPCWTGPGSLPHLLQNLLRNPVEPDLALHQSLSDTKASWNLLRNLLRNPVAQGLTWLCTEASQTFSGTCGTFSGTLLNLTRRLHQCTPELFWAEDPISRGLERTLNFGVGSKNWPVWNVRAAVANDRIQISCLNSSNYLGCFMF